MKQILITGISVLIMIMSVQANAQNCGSEKDSLKILEQNTIWDTYYNQGKRLYKSGDKEKAFSTFNDARSAFFWVFRKFPACNKAVLINGPKLIKYYIEMEKDEARKNELIDTLFVAYDLRIQHFGEEGKVLQYKGVDMSKYKKADFDAAYETLHKGIELEGNKSLAAALQYYARNLMLNVQAGTKTCDDAITAYLMLGDIIEHNRESRGYEAAEKNILKMMTTCLEPEILINLYTDKFEANKENITWLQKSKQLMIIKQCLKVEDEELKKKAEVVWQKIIEAIHAIEPSFSSSIALGGVYVGKDDTKADAYIQQALKLASTDDEKVEVYNTLCAYYFNQKQYARVRTEARKALAVKANNQSYSWIAEAYGTSQEKCLDLQLGGVEVYWISVDYLYKAKAAAETEKEKVHIQNRINKISSYFPKATDESIFMHGIKEGQAISVGCWIGETTTARLR
jgi:tetratricopeptide (TPR) repeat protein